MHCRPVQRLFPWSLRKICNSFDSTNLQTVNSNGNSIRKNSISFCSQNQPHRKIRLQWKKKKKFRLAFFTPRSQRPIYHELRKILAATFFTTKVNPGRCYPWRRVPTFLSRYLRFFFQWKKSRFLYSNSWNFLERDETASKAFTAHFFWSLFLNSTLKTYRIGLG